VAAGTWHRHETLVQGSCTAAAQGARRSRGRERERAASARTQDAGCDATSLRHLLHGALCVAAVRLLIRRRRLRDPAAGPTTESWPAVAAYSPEYANAREPQRCGYN
jgi:hypothetical protein